MFEILALLLFLVLRIFTYLRNIFFVKVTVKQFFLFGYLKFLFGY